MKKWIVIILGAITWSLTIVKSGWIYSYGMGFWGANGHDGVWHIALIESMLRGNFGVPTFAGEALRNYHIGFDYLMALLSGFTNISPVTLYFQIVPPILAILIGLLTYKFVSLWTKSSTHALWSTFFIYFGGSFGWLIGKGESAFWSQQAISTLINPPFALSLVLILLGLISLIKNKWIWVVIYFGLLVQVKVYAGLLVLGGLLMSGLYMLLTKEGTTFLKVFLATLTLSLVLFIPFNSRSFGLVVFQPFWFLETMMHLTDRVGWVRFGEAMLNYKSGGVLIKGLLAYGAAFAIFILGNFGTRLMFLFRRISLDAVHVFMYSIIGAGIIIPMFFLQKGTPWNTIQFFYYSLFFSGILAGIAVPKSNRYALALIVLLSVPTTFLALRDVYIPSRPPAMISKEEVAALKFLSGEENGVVLTHPFDPVKAKEAEGNPPRPLYLYESTAYVSAFSKKATFLEDQVNLDITGYDWKARRKEVENWYKDANQESVRKFLKDNHIKYIYWVKPQRALLGESQLGLTLLYENSEVQIYKTLD